MCVRVRVCDTVHRQFTVMHRDIELNRIDDKIIVIKQISVGSHP